MYKKSIIIVMTCIGIFTSLQAQVVTSTKGMRYQFYKNVTGDPGKIGEVVKFHLIIESADGTILQNTQMVSPEPQLDLVKEVQFPWSYEEIFTIASAGDSVGVMVSSDSIFSPKYNEQQRPPNIAEHSDIKFVFKIVQFISRELYEKEANEKLAGLYKEQEITIDALVKKNKLVAKKTTSGLQYVKTKAGTGANPQVGDKIKVHYTGRLIDSTQFDSSVDRGQPFEFELGAHQVIAGWDEGLALMKKGEKGILFLPSNLGYGPNGAGGNIGPNSILIFDVELVDFESKNPAPKTNTPVKKTATPVKKMVKKPSTKPVTTKKTQLK